MMSTQSKKVQDCLPSAPSSPTGIANVDGREHKRRSSKNEECKKSARKQKTAQPQTAQKTKVRQPTISRALRRAEVLEAIKSASKRKPSGIAPDSCGKPGAPHDLEGAVLMCHATRSSQGSVEEAPSRARCCVTRLVHLEEA